MGTLAASGASRATPRCVHGTRHQEHFSGYSLGVAASRTTDRATLMHVRRLGLLSAGLLMGLGCGSQLSWRDGQVQHRDLTFEIAHPGPDWTQMKVSDRGTAAFERNADTIREVSGRCGSRHDIPLEVLRRHLLLGFRDVSFVEEQRRQLVGREALDSRILASLDGVPRQLRVVVLKKDGCVFDLLEISAPSAAAALPSQAQAEEAATPQTFDDDASDFSAWLDTFRVRRTPRLKGG